MLCVCALFFYRCWRLPSKGWGAFPSYCHGRAIILREQPALPCFVEFERPAKAVKSAAAKVTGGETATGTKKAGAKKSAKKAATKAPAAKGKTAAKKKG